MTKVLEKGGEMFKGVGGKKRKESYERDEEKNKYYEIILEQKGGKHIIKIIKKLWQSF